MINKSLSFLVKCSQTSTVWLFNCPEGTQHTLIHKRIKIHHITDIIITHLCIDNVAGLMGLLSSLSLSSRVQKINIYGPHGIFQYLHFCRKYSQTTFKYRLDIHTIEYGYIHHNISHITYAVPINPYNNKINYNIIEREKIGRFQLVKAQIFHIVPGPIYGYLKSQGRLLTPDGHIIFGKYFTDKYYMGLKIICLINKYNSRSSHELIQISEHNIN